MARPDSAAQPVESVQIAFGETPASVVVAGPASAPALDALPGEEVLQGYLNADLRATSVTDTGKPSYTIDQAASQIVRGEPGWSFALGVGFTVTYAYRAEAPATMPSDTGGFSRFNAQQITEAEFALKSWSDVANIRFVRVGAGTSDEIAYSDNATILLGNYSTGESGAAAFSYMPGITSVSSKSGDVWINSTFAYNQNPTIGNYGGSVLVHEIGHAIGMAHPSEYDATSNSTSASLTYGANASYYEDDRQYSIMSYFSESNTGASYRGVYPAAPQLDDIAAAQLEYGANMSTRTGDTVYGFGSNAGQPWFSATSSGSRLVFAVWDAAGRDTFDFSGYLNNQVIDLRAGNFSNVGGLVGNVAIAPNVLIENAIGGYGDDSIRGNDGGDSIVGGAGNDSIVGGDGPNQLMGYDGNDSIVGGAATDNINGNKGNDTVDGGSGGFDSVYGGQGDDIVTLHAGASMGNGNIGNDTVYGAAGGDTLYGGQNNDLILAGSGADQLYGDLGDDTLTGAAGADTFHFLAGRGHDRITDFHVGEGDRLQLDGSPAYVVGASGADTLVTLTATGDTIVLAGVAPGTLTGGWLVLA